MHQGITTKVSITTSRRIRFSLVSLRAREAVSRTFRYDLSVKGSAGLDIERLLGMGVAVRIDQPGRNGRYFHGVVDQVGAGPVSGKTGYYELVLVPAIAELARCGRHRVHLEVPLPDLVEAMLSEHGIAFESRLSREHPPHDLIIQYNESDLDFVSRLLELEGIFYTFEHAIGGHTFVMWDDPAGLQPWPGYDTQAFTGETGQGEGIVRLDPWARSRVARVELDDVDPDRPELDLSAAAGIARRGESCTTRHDYPGGYTDPNVGALRADVRLQAGRVGFQSARGVAASRGIVAGRRFTLQGNPAFADDTALVPIDIDTVIEAGPVTAAGPKLVVATISCELTTTPLGQPMPLPCATRRPDLHGPHTARVDGPAGEAIHVDESGRVQVRFPWQQADDQSPWVRLSQNWAGPGRGMLVVPRVGDEVLVEFEHGDARRPIVVGALFNGNAQPPLSLPDNKAQTLFQTRSIDGGTENRMRFDDTGGAELMAMEAGRDYRLSVDNDAFVEIGHHFTETVSGDHAMTVDGDHVTTVDGTSTVSLGSDLTTVVDRKVDVTSGKSMTVTSDDTLTVTAGKRIAISGQHSIRIENQNASIELQADGDVIISGKRVTVKASGKLTLKGRDVVEQEG